MATETTTTASKTPSPATKPAIKPVAKPAAKPVTKSAGKTVAKTAAKTAPKAATKPAAKAPAKAPTQAAAKKATKPVAKAAADKPAKEKKIKMVRDSFTIPKLEFVVLEELKLRAAKLSAPVKKTELIRAGIKALAAMPDAGFLSAVRAVPSLKTGRPSKAK
jgi:hypothetical protein